jgi:hypothetical protein
LAKGLARNRSTTPAAADSPGRGGQFGGGQDDAAIGLKALEAGGHFQAVAGRQVVIHHRHPVG